MNDDLAFTSSINLLELIATKEISPVEITQLYLNRIEKLDSHLNSYLLLTADLAIEQARKSENDLMTGADIGPLHGLPISVKDSQMTKGIRTTLGSIALKDNIPTKDAAIIEKVKKAGAIILGKTNLPEFGAVGTCENHLGDDGRNPWNTSYTPGGSSGGAAAAVAAGLCALATGGDGGGSIRIPASFCGIYGIKPSQGRVSGFSGVESETPMPNIFGQPGPLSRTVADSALLLNVIAGHDPRDPTTARKPVPDFMSSINKDIKGLRIAWSPNYGFASVDQEVIDVCYKAAMIFEQLGCQIEETSLKLESPYDAYGPIYELDAYMSYGQYYQSHKDKLTHFAKYFIESGSRISAPELSQALGLIEVLKSKINTFFSEYDLLISPTLSVAGIPIGEFPSEIAGKPSYPHKYFGFHPFTYPINAVGCTAASIPAGFSSEGLPIGLHIVGRKWEEETVFAASAALEKANPWIGFRPKIS